MGIVRWITDLFTGPVYEVTHVELISNTISDAENNVSHDEFAVNPATGLPMVDGISSVDAAGNPFGMDLSQDDAFTSGIDNSYCGGIDDTFSIGNGLVDW